MEIGYMLFKEIGLRSAQLNCSLISLTNLPK
jgi:hypothetical protein